MQKPTVPEKVLPCPLGSHHTGIVLLVLSSDLGSGELRAVMFRHMVLLEAGAMRRRVETSGLLENNRLSL